jgi:acetylornithine deacetylase/succinyl-diaminopimelate desuccinylase-like protein
MPKDAKMVLANSPVATALAVALSASMLSVPALGQSASPAGSPVERAFDAVHADLKVTQALADLRADDARTYEEQKRIAQIASPPFKEKVRAEYFLKRLKETGLADAETAPEGYVIATRKGSGGRPKLVVSAHLDTVFPEGTDVTVTERDGVAHGAGIGDDARGLAVLLSVSDALNKNRIETVGDVIFVGTVGEEELGNLRGVKALFRDQKEIDGFISVDGIDVSRLINRGTGSHRYEITFKAPGGHSFQEFGLPSAVHAMGRAIAKIADVQVPKDPKTTFTVGTVQGGTSVNAIAGEARMGLDMRSNDEGALLKEEEQILGLVKQAAEEENRRWTSTAVTVEIKLIGDRPAGLTPADSPIVQTARRSIASVLKDAKINLTGGSTDSNVAMSLGVPAVTISGGGEGGNQHSRSEWYKPVNAYAGPQNALLTLLTLVGIKGVSEPVLPPHR